MNREIFDDSALPVCILRSRMEAGEKRNLVLYNDVLFRPNSKMMTKAVSDDSSDFTFTPYHYHEGVEILRIVEGEAKIVINNRVFLMKAGDVAVVNPFEAHGIYLKDRYAPFVRDCVSFQPINLFPDSSGAGGAMFSQLKSVSFANPQPESVCASVSAKIDRIVAEAQGGRPGWSVAALSEVVRIYASVIRGGCFSVEEVDVPARRDFMSRVTGYIDSNFSASISSSDAAAFCQYSSEYFCRLFKKCFHTTFLDYLNVYRVQKAKSFIDEGNYPTVAELASAFGFSSQNHFGNMFKRHVGILPSAYIRKRIKEKR